MALDSSSPLDPTPEQAVRERYAAAAARLEPAPYETNQAVAYRGPWRRVEDDDGHVLVRGERTAVCEKTFRLLTSDPYDAETIPIPAREAVPDAKGQTFDSARPRRRDPRETMGEAYGQTEIPARGPDESCC